jgi:uncharacterized protein YifE (UPF0438 family)
MMPGNGINYEKCNSSKKIVKKKFFFVFFYLECCKHKLIKKTMKSYITTQSIEVLFKVTPSVSLQLAYNDLHINRKLYTNRGCNARAVINWLTKEFGINTFVNGNDAPRGGKHGNFVTFETNEAFEQFAQSIKDFEIKKDAEVQADQANFENMKLMAKDFIKNNAEIVDKYKAKHGTNSRGLQISAWKLSTIAIGKGLHITKTAFFHSL